MSILQTSYNLRYVICVTPVHDVDHNLIESRRPGTIRMAILGLSEAASEQRASFRVDCRHNRPISAHF